MSEIVVDSYSVRVPTYVSVSNSTIKPVNLNIYRNLHHYHLDRQKKEFTQAVMPLLKGKPFAKQIWIHYTIFASRKGRLDTMNIGSIVDKYFCDVLVKAGKIPDDHYEHVILSTFSFGGVDSMNGHAIATVNILERSQPMRILLDQNDIQNALNAYVSGMCIPNATGEVDITINNDFKIEAEIIIATDDDDATDEADQDQSSNMTVAEEDEDKPQPKKRRGRPKGSKNKPKEDDADVMESTEDSSTDSAGGGSEASEEPSETGETKASGGKGNLFGDSDTEESSDSPTESESDNESDGEVETSEEEATDPPVMKAKKKSIFDA